MKVQNESDMCVNFESFNADQCASNFHQLSVDCLQCLHKYTLHEILSSLSFKVESEDAFLQTLIDFGSQYFEFSCHIEVKYLTSKSISNFVENLKFDLLNESIWIKIVDCLKGEIDNKVKMRRYRVISVEAMILKSYPKILFEFSRK
jgi:hypothetical protein